MKEVITLELIDRRQKMEDATAAYCARVAARINKERTKRRWSQEILAQEAMVSKQTITLIESGKSVPQLNTLYKICRAFGTTPAVFLAERRRKGSGDSSGQSQRNGYPEPVQSPIVVSLAGGMGG